VAEEQVLVTPVSCGRLRGRHDLGNFYISATKLLGLIHGIDVEEDTA